MGKLICSLLPLEINHTVELMGWYVNTNLWMFQQGEWSFVPFSCENYRLGRVLHSNSCRTYCWKANLERRLKRGIGELRLENSINHTCLYETHCVFVYFCSVLNTMYPAYM